MNPALKTAVRQQTTGADNLSGGNAPAPAATRDPLGHMMEKLKPSLALALPSTMNPERVSRVALTELRTNPKLAEAAQSNPASFMGAMLKASALGLEIGNGLGHAYLVPYDKREKRGNQWVTVGTEIQLIIGYRGMIDLSRRSGQIESLYAVEVYANEPFEVTLGLSNDIQHKRVFNGSVSMSPESVIAVYAVAKLKGGEVQFDVMTKAQIEAIRSRSKASANGPWVTDWVEMAKKTVLRRLFKMLPVSIEMKTNKDSRTLSLDVAGDDDGLVIDQNGAIISGDVSGQQGSAATDTPSQIEGAVKAMEEATTVEALDEVYIRAEVDFDGAKLETLVREYRRIKANLTGSLV
ncbi:MAG: recombinase RecT [Pseudomonadota bacterium]|nr:recombinase RecT [Pseudomonadota bacterium]MDP1905517.1 recombinase RecT [Pseudomonadota bacterium]